VAKAPALGTPGHPILCAVTDLAGAGEPSRLESLLDAGLDWIQLRDRRATDGEMEAFLTGVQAAAPRVLDRLLLNDRLSLAATFPVGGLHLPEAGLPVELARDHFPALRIGRSAHSLESAREAARQGADYVILGPAFPTGQKRDPLAREEFLGTGRLGLPVWAIGGITPANGCEVAKFGISGVAAIRALREPDQVRALRGAVVSCP